ncbi:MAG: thioesterase family protein [Verrucomicrobiota bacterium]
MKDTIRIGMTAQITFRVERPYTIDFAGAGMPEVLSTPALINFMERTARLALRPALEDGESSVGMELEIRHLAPTPPGHTVTCTARVIHAEDKIVTLQVEASDETELIARCMHKRAIINKERFAGKVDRKKKNG